MSTTPPPFSPAAKPIAGSQIIVLAAGKGTRMNSELPKVLCPVAGRPMIHWVLDAAAAAGIQRAIVVVGYRAGDVEAELTSRNEDIRFVRQNEQLGTGHAVQMAGEFLTDPKSMTVVVAGDSPLLQPDSLSRLIDDFDQRKLALLLGSLSVDDPTGLGRIVRTPGGQFTGIVEQRDATAEQRAITEVNMSTYVFRTGDLVDALAELTNDNAQGEYYITDCASILLQSGRPVDAAAVLRPCEALSINNPEQLAAVDAKMRQMGYANA